MTGRRIILAAAYSIFGISCLSFGTGAQQQTMPTKQLVFPLIPIIVEYEYAPIYFYQDIDNNPQYSSITAIISKTEPPVYKIVLAEKETGRRVYYSNSQAKVKALEHEGKEAHVTAIDYKVVQTVGQQPTYGFGFRDSRGQPILWRFIPASNPSKLGAGLTPLPEVPGLRLDYRDLSTTAGSGTAVQIGNQVSEAAPWPEISTPPYFLAHHGAYTQGRHIGALLARPESWRVIAAPQDLKEGGEWTLKNERGVERKMRITARRGDEMTISEFAIAERDSAILTLEVRALLQGFALRSILLTNNSHGMRITFNPELNLSPEKLASTSNDVAFQIDQGDNNKVVQGSIIRERLGNFITLRWMPKNPDWTKSRVLNTKIKLDSASYSIEGFQ